MYYINVFFLFSILGHWIENFFYTTRDSGILYGYWTPIYGFGVVAILLLSNKIIKRFPKRKILNVFLTFVLGGISLSLLEFVGGIMIEKILHITFWDYSYESFSIGRYTSGRMILVWGACSVFVSYILKPLLDCFIHRLPKLVTYLLITLFTIDCILTLSPYMIK